MTNILKLWEKVGQLADAAEEFGNQAEDQINTGKFDYPRYHKTMHDLVFSAYEYQKAAKAVDAEMAQIAEPVIQEI